MCLENTKYHPFKANPQCNRLKLEALLPQQILGRNLKMTFFFLISMFSNKSVKPIFNRIDSSVVDVI